MHIVHALALAAASCTGCVVGVGSTDSDPQLDAMVLASVHQYRSATKINVQPLSSLLGPFDVNYFVAGDVSDFLRVHPEQSGSKVRLEPGTVIVREVLGESGQAAKLTVMAKGPAGFDPTLGDWWFGVTDVDGIPLEENGALLIGRLQQCHECHRERTQDDFLFGVPAMM